MRVITGTARGRRLKEPANYDIRPTTDMVKEAVFNIIQFSAEDARVLDMFAGTGQLGIEALSRGAKEAVFIDNAEAAVRIIRENAALCGLSDRSKIIRGDSVETVKGLGKFDIIFIDPPYDTDLYEKALGAVNEFDILKENGIIICESRKERELPDLSAPYNKVKEYRYGKIKITVFGKDGGQITEGE